MLNNILFKISHLLVGIGLFLLAHSGYQHLGATNPIEQPIALFETSLQTGISSTATSLTLTSGTDKDSNTLASSTYSFIIDEGTSVAELVKGDCTGTSCTNLTRGVSVRTGTSSVSALQFAHRRGATVKITTAPLLLNLTNILNGKDTIPNVLSYTSGPVFNSSLQLATKGYVDGITLAGAATSTESVNGIVRLATAVQAASSTATTPNIPLVIQAQNCSSAYTPSVLRCVITQNNGTIDPNFIATSSLSNYTFGASTTISNTLAVGLRLTVASSTVFNGLSEFWPSARGAASTTLTEDGSGNLAWGSRGSTFIGTVDDVSVTSATRTIASLNVAANTFLNGGVIRVTASATSTNRSGSANGLSLNVSLGGNATSTCGFVLGDTLSTPSAATSTFSFVIRATSATTQHLSCNSTHSTSGTFSYQNNTSLTRNGGDQSSVNGSANLAVAQTLYIDTLQGLVPTSNLFTSVFGVTVEMLNQ